MVAGGAQPPAHFEAVQARHCHVEDDGVSRTLSVRRERRLAVLSGLSLIALETESPLQGLADGGLVVDDQDSHAQQSVGKI